MTINPRSVQEKYDDRGTVGYLLGSIEYARHKLSDLQNASTILERKATGDMVTLMDITVHDAVVEYFQKNSIRAHILGEEGQHYQENPEFAVLIDEIEGTTNVLHGLDHGINIAIAKYKPLLTVGDLEAAVVVNLKTDSIYVGERGRGGYKIVGGVEQEFSKREATLYECPSPWAYTVVPDQVALQKMLSKIFYKVLGNQPRSIDATGTRLVELADSKIRAYGDFRYATKPWDVLPSALIVEEAGYVFTDGFGFDLSNAIFYDEDNSIYSGTGGLNTFVGRNFIAANPEDHELLLFGKGSPKGRDIRTEDEINCVWDYLIYDYGEHYLYDILVGKIMLYTDGKGKAHPEHKLLRQYVKLVPIEHASTI